MALDVSTFKTRALSALVFVVLMLTGLLWNRWSFFILFSIVHFGCWFEYQRLLVRIDPDYAKITPFHRYGVMIAGFCVMLFCTTNAFRIGSISLHNMGLLGILFFIFVLPAIEIVFVGEISLKNLGYSILGLLYISLSIGLLTNLRGFFYGSVIEFIDKMLVLMIIASLWINDTVAYLAGSLIGRTPLTSISPKKTWEGTIAGVVFAVAIMGMAGYWAGSDMEWQSALQWMVIAAISAVSGTLGDLLESKIKRMAQVKDSGRILPGHGGFLDRFDSVLLAGPCVWVYVVLFIK